MIPAPRLRLKRPTGWFAAGQEVATALPLLSDAAFKLASSAEFVGRFWLWESSQVVI